MAMPSLESWTQVYRNYDRAFVDFIHLGIKYPPVPDDARPLVCVFATPERAFAQIDKRLPDTPDDAQKKYPLSFASIDRLAVEYDIKRDRRAKLRRFMYNADRTKFWHMDWPIPVVLTYQVTLWSRLLRDLDDLNMQMHLLFPLTGPIAYIEVDHPFPMDSKIILARLTESRQLPMIESPKSQRTIRRENTVTMEGWIVRAPEEVGIVESIDIDVYHSEDMETEDYLLDSYTVEE